MSVSSAIKPGILSLSGADAASKATAERLLKKDYVDHHCYFHDLGLHNHISHHILAAYDLGATASLIQAIFDEELKIQRPIDLKQNGVIRDGVLQPGEVKEDNWTEWLGDQRAYYAYVVFFENRLAALGSVRILEEYVFSPSANANGACMLFRFFGGLLHPFIQVGYGLEFDNECQIVAGLASAAIHKADEKIYLRPTEFVDATSTKRPSVLSLLREIYDSSELVPLLPYEPGVFIFDRVAHLVERDGGSRIKELQRIVSHFDPGTTPEELDDLVEELIFTSTLMTFATGKKDRKPRVDFHLLHLLTSSLFVPPFLKHIPKMEDKRALLRTFLQAWMPFIMTAGRPRIDPALLMTYTANPLPPNTSLSAAHPSAIGGNVAENMSPWPAIIADVLHAPDAHSAKTIRSLLYGAIKYGTLPKGGVRGGFDEDGKELHPGIAQADGTIFVRAAGILMNSLGWVTHGQAAGPWDRSGLGWDDAWKGED